jgi:hypothetical protein
MSREPTRTGTSDFTHIEASERVFPDVEPSPASVRFYITLKDMMEHEELREFALLHLAGGDEQEVAELLERVDQKLAVEEARADRLLRRYGLT